MYWKVHWQNYVNDEEGSFGSAEPHVYSDVYANYEGAWGKYVMLCGRTDELARCWLTVHRNIEDKEGTGMAAFYMLWNDEVKIVE